VADGLGNGERLPETRVRFVEVAAHEGDYPETLNRDSADGAIVWSGRERQGLPESVLGGCDVALLSGKPAFLPLRVGEEIGPRLVRRHSQQFIQPAKCSPRVALIRPQVDQTDRQTQAGLDVSPFHG